MQAFEAGINSTPEHRKFNVANPAKYAAVTDASATAMSEAEKAALQTLRQYVGALLAIFADGDGVPQAAPAPASAGASSRAAAEAEEFVRQNSADARAILKVNAEQAATDATKTYNIVKVSIGGSLAVALLGAGLGAGGIGGAAVVGALTGTGGVGTVATLGYAINQWRLAQQRRAAANILHAAQATGGIPPEVFGRLVVAAAEPLTATGTATPSTASSPATSAAGTVDTTAEEAT